MTFSQDFRRQSKNDIFIAAAFVAIIAIYTTIIIDNDNS